MNHWSVKKVSSAGDWNRLRENSALDGLFYDLNFHTYHVNKDFVWHHIIVFKGSEPVAGMVGAIEDERFISQPGASFGGILFRRGMSTNSLIIIIDRMIDYLKGKGFNNVEIRLPPICYYEPESENVLLSLYHNGFILKESIVTSIIGLANDDLVSLMKSPTRRGALKAERSGIEVVESDSFTTFYPILVRDRKGLGKVPTHSLEELRKLGLLFPDRLVLFLARLEKTILGGLLLFIVNNKVVLNFYLAQDEDGKRYRVANYLALKSILWAEGHGFRYYDFGTSMLDGEINYGLLRFKDGFGARSYLRRILTLGL